MVAGGADSHGYVSQAGYRQRGGVVVQEDVIRPSPWPGAALTWSPLGYRPSPRRPDAIVPLYAPGLPLLMALGQTIAGFCGAFFCCSRLCGALTIWLTYARSGAGSSTRLASHCGARVSSRPARSFSISS